MKNNDGTVLTSNMLRCREPFVNDNKCFMLINYNSYRLVHNDLE